VLASSLARLTPIPYFAWCNRGSSAMIVWLPLARDVRGMAD
jgi:DUF1680 family protein